MDRLNKWYMSFNNPGKPSIMYFYGKDHAFWIGITLSVKNETIYIQDRWNELMLTQDEIYEDDEDEIKEHEKLMIEKLFNPKFKIVNGLG